MTVALAIWLGLVGVCIGSFINAYVWRLHEAMRLEDEIETAQTKKGAAVQAKVKKLRAQLAKRSITRGRSMCPHCEHALAARDLVPVISWLVLRGRCRYCQAGIHWQYPVVEALTGLLFIGSLLAWPWSLHMVSGLRLADSGALGWLFLTVWLILASGLMALAVFDTRWMLLPDRLVFPLMGVAGLHVLLRVLAAPGNWRAVLINAAWGVLVCSGLFAAIYALAERLGREWIGFGDVKLGVVLGLVTGGPFAGLLVLFGSSLFGTLASLPLVVRRQAGGTLIPYGPFLIAAAVLVQLGGGVLLAWLNRFVLLY